MQVEPSGAFPPVVVQDRSPANIKAQRSCQHAAHNALCPRSSRPQETPVACPLDRERLAAACRGNCSVDLGGGGIAALAGPPAAAAVCEDGAAWGAGDTCMSYRDLRGASWCARSTFMGKVPAEWCHVGHVRHVPCIAAAAAAMDCRAIGAGQHSGSVGRVDQTVIFPPLLSPSLAMCASRLCIELHHDLAMSSSVLKRS